MPKSPRSNPREFGDHPRKKLTGRKLQRKLQRKGNQNHNQNQNPRVCEHGYIMKTDGTGMPLCPHWCGFNTNVQASTKVQV